jgi:hypothetical protein
MRRAVLLLVLLSLAFAPAPLPKAGRPQAARGIEGEWEGDGCRVLVTATRLVFYAGTPRAVEYELRHDATTYDLTNARNTFRGIYRIDGDTLTMCYNGDGTRPDRFHPPRTIKGVYTEAYKRVRR